MIAKGISPLRPENARVEAGRILFRKIGEYANNDITFAFESTLSGTGHLKHIQNLKRKGYRIVIYYRELPPLNAAHLEGASMRSYAHVAPKVPSGGRPV